MKRSILKKIIAWSALATVVAGSWITYEKFFSKPYLTIIGVVKMSDGLGRQSVELIDALKDEVKYFRVWIARENKLSYPKPKTFGELKTLCEEKRIKIEREFPPCATVISQTRADSISFYLELSDYRKGPRIATVPVALLYKD